MKKVYAFISTTFFSLVVWILYTQTYSPKLTASQRKQELIAGVIVCCLIGIFSSKFFIKEKAFWFFNPVRVFVLLIFIPIYLFELIKANLDVAFRALSPKVRVKPGIVKIKTEVQSDYGLSMLANCITLTPGTITMDILEEDGVNYMYIHWIKVETQDVKDASKKIKGAFEPWVRRIFR